MPREIDRRDFTINRVTPARQQELQARAAEVSRSLPGDHHVTIKSIDPLTGNPSALVSSDSPAAATDYVQRALAHVQTVSRALGFAETQPVEWAADPNYQQASSGAVAVHLQQKYKGLPIFQAAQAVQFAPDGTITETVGSSVTIDHEVDVAPRLTVQEAVLIAARHVAMPAEDERGAVDQFGEPLPLASVDLTGFQPTVIATFADIPEHPTVLAPGPFGDEIKASLLWFPINNTLRLGWEVILTMPAYEGQYRTIVDAETGEILYCHQLMHTVLAQGNVYRVDGGSPRQMTPFPRPLTDYGLPVPTNLPAGFPDDWVAAASAEGNAVRAHLGDSGPTIQGAVQNGLLTFDPADPVGDEQKVLNIFYFNCFMHDFCYLLGFREADGNFQQSNFGRGGVASDRVDARAYSGPVWGTASMATPIDGSSPIMKMGLVSSTNRHTAFDSSVVFHEFMHGVTNRLVGGPLNARALEAPQSSGMGEGWSDYIACTINDTTVVGSWVVNRPGGIRAFPYDSNFPDDFGKLGTGRYTEVHNIGEIWCATLMELNRRIGKLLALQLVIDALKLSPANPSFLDSRDAILRALDSRLAAGQMSAAEHAQVKRAAWAVFARFGMGPNARSNGASLSGIVADFNPPAEQPAPVPVIHVEGAPNLAIPDNRAVGVSHALTVPQAGRLLRAVVGVDIQHPYIGDLVVTLRSPNGAAAVLHNRAGASADNIVRAYSSDDTPALAALVGSQAQGDWSLHVADLARRDVGVLRRWSLDLELEAPPQVARGEAAPALAIPDNDPVGVSSTIAIAEAGTLGAIQVHVDITHTYIGDLRVELIAPTGAQAILHNRSGGSQDNLIRDYDATTTPALAALVGQPIQGNWVLRVADLAGRDVGKLNRWEIAITYR